MLFKCLRHVLSTNEIFDLFTNGVCIYALPYEQYESIAMPILNCETRSSYIQPYKPYESLWLNRPVGLMCSLHAGICLLPSWGQFPAMAHRRLRAAVFIDTFAVSLHSLTTRCWHQASAVLMSTTIVRNSHWVEWYHHSWLLIFCESHHDVNENSTSHVCSILPIVNVFMDITINSLVNGDHTWTTRYAFEFAIEIFTIPSINEL